MIRVKIELLPHGREDAAEILDTIFITNDGTAWATGEDEGGIGNYEIHDNGTLAHLHSVDYPHMYACGFIKGVERTPTHRLFLAEQALGIVQEARKLEKEGAFDKPHNVFDRPTRDFSPQPVKCDRSKDSECLDPQGYCKNGDCLAVK